ncbi:XTP/dITP diphosphohydrolase [Nocardioides scoriae]|uniref:XTP/dITP diphosphohydrolase n=1 Tax=Nocardioides scoriae TaxID=642780 RepID=A0A1H1SVC7_9ACTN|nr:MazG family protein [Nocardioides scoriae]SDS51925.1 XTP/dITP diphosphohydrolase [Nocardioides scoriae]
MTTTALLEVVAMMRRLRAECGWKAAQTHRTLARHLLEETYELLEAIEAGQDAELREELGDVLLQVLFHAAIAEEQGRFDLEDVAAGLRDKLLHRNPHVFGDLVETDPARINDAWEQAKATEKQRTDPWEGIALALPALSRAAKVLDRQERAGLRTTPRPAPGPEAELGDQLLALVAQARSSGIDPEQALRDAVRRTRD